PDAGADRGGARVGDAVCGNQRCRGAGFGGARPGDDGWGGAQLSSTGQYDDDVDCERRPGAVPRGDRACARERFGGGGGPHPGAKGGGVASDCNRTAYDPFKPGNSGTPNTEPGAGRAPGLKDTPMTLQNGATAVADNVIKETTTAAFTKDVIEDSRRQPVLV